MSCWTGQSGPLLIAEIGGNHEGDFDAAKRLVDLALEAGADVIKFQILSADGLINPRQSPQRHAHFARFELAPEQHLALAERVRAGGARYNASVWEPAALDWIDPMLDFYKIGSGDLTAYALLEAHAARGKPMLLSTGLASLAEVQASVAHLRKVAPVYAGDDMLALLQCTSLYPTPPAQVNLAAMRSLREATGLAVGYSHHAHGSLALLAAAALGAEILEFHFTDNREGRGFRDHAISLTAPEVRALREQLRGLGELLGSAEKNPTHGELDAGHVASFRRAVYCVRDLRAGDTLRAEDLVALRPNCGVDARDLTAVIGRRVARDTPAFAALELEVPA